MNNELITELNEELKQLEYCSLCDSTNLQVELYLNEESAFRISCMTCNEDISNYPSEEQIINTKLQEAINSDLLVR
tara:strand:- start:108 stop:335 length:228 start_codon:yes stop_codon:yes gene_type:complete